MKLTQISGLWLGSALLAVPTAVVAEQLEVTPWKSGVAVTDITPEGPVWLNGYGFRNKPSEGIDQRLHAKALAIEDGAGTKMVFITLDLIGVPRPVRQAVERVSKERYGLRPESILLNASHTHSGPSPSRRDVGDAAFVAKAEAYGRALVDKIDQVIGEALSRREPVELHYTRARAGFAMNRRLPVGAEIRNSPNPDGPIDHDVPVLRVTGRDGKLRALLFGYACHNTVTGFYTINGDYAGYAQAYLEETRPGVVAMFMMGAGGDQNPYPRHVSLEQSAQHGRTLAYAVEAALAVATPRRVLGPLRSAYGYAELEFAETSRADLERRAHSPDAAERTRAEELLRKLDAHEQLPQGYPCPVQVVQFGTELILVAVGGEPTVEYSLRLKRELGTGRAAVWVAGYCNDAFGYLGSRRVIIEGGYEGNSANLGLHPGPWAITTEDRVIEKVYELIRSINR